MYPPKIEFRSRFVREASTSQPARDWCTSLHETCFCPRIFSPFCSAGVRSFYVTSMPDPPLEMTIRCQSAAQVDNTEHCYHARLHSAERRSSAITCRLRAMTSVASTDAPG